MNTMALAMEMAGMVTMEPARTILGTVRDKEVKISVNRQKRLLDMFHIERWIGSAPTSISGHVPANWKDSISPGEARDHQHVFLSMVNNWYHHILYLHGGQPQTKFPDLSVRKQANGQKTTRALRKWVLDNVGWALRPENGTYDACSCQNSFLTIDSLLESSSFNTWVLHWQQSFGHDSIQYTIDWSPEAFESLGSYGCDDGSCFREEHEWEHAPVALAAGFNQDIPTFIVHLTQGNANARCIGIVGPDGDIFLTNGYFDHMKHHMQLFARAVESAAQTPLTMKDSTAPPLTMYFNGDGVLAWPSGWTEANSSATSFGYRRICLQCGAGGTSKPYCKKCNRTCIVCGEAEAAGDYETCMDRAYCETCYDELHNSCERCDETIHNHCNNGSETDRSYTCSCGCGVYCSESCRQAAHNCGCHCGHCD